MILSIPTLFLDFDGVLHTESNVVVKPFHQLPLLEAELLNSCVELQIVISSSWRYHYSLREMKSNLKSLGGFVTGVTPDIRFCSHQRYHEIMEVVSAYRIPDWRALDDTRDLFPNDCEQLIECDPRRGFQAAEAGQLREWIRAINNAGTALNTRI